MVVYLFSRILILADFFAKFSQGFIFYYGLQWTKFNLQLEIRCDFADISERVVLSLRDKIDFEKDIKQLHSGNTTNLVRNLSYFSISCEHNIQTFDRVRN